MSDPTEAHPTRLIRASISLLDDFGTRTEDGRRLTATWGEAIGHCPDSDEYIYEPTFTATDDGYAIVRSDDERAYVNAYIEGRDAALREALVARMGDMVGRQAATDVVDAAFRAALESRS